MIVNSDDFFAQRKRSEWVKRHREAERVHAALSATDNLSNLFGPIKIGEVDFGPWDPAANPIEFKSKKPRRLPLYLFACEDGHRTFDYPHGQPSYLMCFCRLRCRAPGAPVIRPFVDQLYVIFRLWRENRRRRAA